MKKYKLKQWYPSLGGDFKNGEKIIFWEERGCYVKNFGDDISLRKTEVENNPDFWELIEDKKPLFTTADRVDIFEGDKFILVTDNFIKHEAVACNDLHREGFYRTFKYEFSADKYILWNKPLLNLKDIEVGIKGHLPEFVELIRLAEERDKLNKYK